MESVPWPLVIYIVFMAVVLTLFVAFVPGIRAIVLKRNDGPELWAVCAHCAKGMGEMDMMCICSRCRASVCSDSCFQRHQERRHSRKDAA